jgi:anaerobic selenocysteine-containing dehydrogenase
MSQKKTKFKIKLNVNGKPYRFSVEPNKMLIDILRAELKLGSTKEGCGVGKCGTCSVIMDGKTVPSCLILAVEADGKNIITSEGLGRELEFHPFDEAHTSVGVMRASSDLPGMKSRQEYFTFCHLCCGHCSIKVGVEDGKVVDLAPDMESGFPNDMCPFKKSRLSVPEILTHPDRLLYPQKRVGERGEGKWERISWEEALDTIVTKFKDIRDNYGPEYLAMCLGEPKGMEFAFGQRFASAFGTNNVFTPGWSCGIPNAGPSMDTCGWNMVVDEVYLPKLLVVWGLNISHMSWGIRREKVAEGLRNGMKMIVVDPRKIDLADMADMWIKIRPGGDGALAMGLLKVIIEEKLYDEDVVKNWTVGFDKLVDEIKTFTLDDVEKVTYVPRQQIIDFARMYAQTKPAAIQWGNAVDQNINQYHNNRAISILRGICGNLNVKGGDVFLSNPPWLRPGKFYFPKGSNRHVEKSLGQEFVIPMKTAFVPAPVMTKSLLKGEPYRLKAAWVILSDPIMSYPDADATYEAFKQLEFLVVNELFMTPTAALADIVLPVAWGMEHNELGYWPGWQKQLRAHPKLVDPPGECWPDTKIVNEVANRLGLGEFFWEDDEDALEEMLQPSGMNYEEFVSKKRRLLPPHEYHPHHYDTPSGKIEIYSEKLEKMRLPPMPTWKIVSTLPKVSKKYPLLLSNFKEEAYVLSGYKHVASLRTIRPQPTIEINPKTASKYGLQEGDWVNIETEDGKITQKLNITPDLHPGVVLASFGWWFPEDGAETLYGWKRANLNMLTEHENVSKECGSPWCRGIPCRVYKAAGPNG